MKINRFEDLEIWIEARELCRVIFKITSDEPFRITDSVIKLGLLQDL